MKFITCLFLWSLVYLHITAKYDMPFSLEQRRGARRWTTTSALGLQRKRRAPNRSVNLHGRIFAMGSIRVFHSHRGRRNTACRFTAKAVCNYNVPMSVGTYILESGKIRLCENDMGARRGKKRHALFTRTVADRPGIRTVSQPLHSVLFTVGSLMVQVSGRNAGP
jgi:hypothetical protein